MEHALHFYFWKKKIFLFSAENDENDRKDKIDKYIKNTKKMCPVHMQTKNFLP